MTRLMLSGGRGRLRPYGTLSHDWAALFLVAALGGPVT